MLAVPNRMNTINPNIFPIPVTKVFDNFESTSWFVYTNPNTWATSGRVESTDNMFVFETEPNPNNTIDHDQISMDNRWLWIRLFGKVNWNTYIQLFQVGSNIRYSVLKSRIYGVSGSNISKIGHLKGRSCHSGLFSLLKARNLFRQDVDWLFFFLSHQYMLVFLEGLFHVGINKFEINWFACDKRKENINININGNCTPPRPSFIGRHTFDRYI